MDQFDTDDGYVEWCYRRKRMKTRVAVVIIVLAVLGLLLLIYCT